ncbi:DUF2318 domain-containing protein [Candidatus Bathyarchaeota archaeon]|nr:DUF2318 domain-containing protein [Candidatus Bathyarchaeota archaeon]MBS7618221.1 DUF2318 domain-containing protein [Candidatus Bathyarchaeota archaeon]
MRFRASYIILLAAMFLVAIALLYFQSSIRAGSFYLSPTISPDGTKVYVPLSFVKEQRLVFLDLKIENRLNEITYKGRTIPLSLYKDGEYLPLVIILTQSRKIISGIRVCEPCGSFSFHIIQEKYLDCDACHTRWDVESLKGISGACTNYPPPELPSSLMEDLIEIDLSSLEIRVKP